jgi:pterin-4a-carbinolamine dehydratase
MYPPAIIHTEVLSTKLRRPPEKPPEYLKSERVQQELKAMQSWRALPTGRAIVRDFRLSSQRAAATYAAFVSAYAGDRGQPVHLHMNGRTLSVKLFSPYKTGRAVPLTMDVIDFARSLG